MKRYILFFTFIFAALSSATAQRDCSVRPINVFEPATNPETGPYTAVNLPHNPCEQAVEIYMMLKANPGATVNWQVVQSEMSDIPAEGWIIVDHNNHTMAGGAAGFEYTEPGANGKTYFAAAIRSGRKAGVIKATVTDPDCANGTKVATLAVRPGLLPVTLTEECTGAIKTFTATATPSKQANSVKGYTNTWIFPSYWTYNGTAPVTAGPAGYSMVTTADVNTASFTTVPDPHPGTTETVSVETVAHYNGNNGQGVGNANCDFGTAEAVAESCIAAEVCLAGKSITAETAAGSDITITYQGSTVVGANTTVSFAVASEETIDQLFIQPLIFDPTSTTVTATANNGYAAVYDESTNNIVYSQGGAAGSNNLTVSFTIPTDDFAEVYGLRVVTASSSGISTTYTGREGDVLTCEFGDLQTFAVELASFAGKATASGIELTWTTASEKDNDRFEVQRSTNGKDFKAIGTVKGAGNSATALSYTFTDRNPGKGTNYYRLSMIETNGSTELSNVIAIENSSTTTSGITLYPNPATGDNLTITLNGSELSNRDFIISISDINGRKAFEQKFTGTGSNEIRLSLNKLNISKGLYLVKVLGENIIETQKLLIK